MPLNSIAKRSLKKDCQDAKEYIEEVQLILSDKQAIEDILQNKIQHLYNVVNALEYFIDSDEI